MNRQRGGTFLGIVIGIVIGLGAALAVAVYVTKVPIPFVNKGQSRTSDQDAAEDKKNKGWDPNAPLYGKNPARATLPASAPVAPAATVELPPAAAVMRPAPVPADAKPAGKPEAKATASSADPLGDLAKARSATSGADPFSYFVQAGAYRTAEDAEGQRAKLSLGGIEAKVSEREQAGRIVYRVRVGPFDKREDADRTKDKLESLGMEAALVRVQR